MLSSFMCAADVLVSVASSWHFISTYHLRTTFFWAITQQVVVIAYRRFRTTYRPHLHWTLEDGTDMLPRNVGKKLPLFTA